MKKITFLTILMLMIFSVKSFAQSEKNPWAIGAGFDIIDVTSKKPLRDYFGKDDWNTRPIISRLYIARRLNKSFTIDGTGSFKKITKIVSATVPEKNFYSLDLGLRYNLSRLIGKDAGWFDPYAKVSAGWARVDSDDSFILAPSLGTNFWFSEKWGINLETSWKTSDLIGNELQLGSAMYVGKNFLQHSISVVYRFGGSSDKDSDGVKDSEDECPEIPGLKEFNGCPDSDGDGFADKDDKCPDVAGKLNGCPDSDGDGVADADDNCPNKAGKFNGCPDTDGDGVPDDRDNCINEAGPKSNKGCPEEVVEVIVEEDTVNAELENYAKSVEFHIGKSTLDKAGVKAILENVVDIMKKYRNAKFNIGGHTDNTGPETFNKTLSIDRAQAVADYLISHGIDSSRLNIAGYGESRPKATNSTSAGRALNRRVEVKVD